MKTFFTDKMSNFWINIMEKLNTDTDRKKVTAEVIEDLCMYFGFGCSFIYLVDRNGVCTLYESFERYHNHEHISNRLLLKEKLGDTLYEEFSKVNYISANNIHPTINLLEEKLMDLFFAKSYVLTPIIGEHNEIQAIIGMVDRRGTTREGDQDIRFAYSILAVVSNFIKITLSQRQSEGTLSTLSSVINNTGVDVYVLDFYTDEILYMNDSMAKHYGSLDDIIGKNISEVVFKSQEIGQTFFPKDKIIDKDGKPTEVYIWNLYNKEEDLWLRMLSSAFYWIDGRLAHVVSSVDITDNKKNEEKIRYYAEYDPLTGLANRHKLLLDCDDGIERLKNEGKEGFLIFCDLNKFKQINDELGHTVGDDVLMSIGNFFQSDERTKNRAYRYGGDEFILLCLDCTKNEVDELLAYLETEFNKPWILDNQEIYCNTSFGVTRYPQDATTTSDLLHSADLSMYRAKSVIR